MFGFEAHGTFVSRASSLKRFRIVSYCICVSSPSLIESLRVLSCISQNMEEMKMRAMPDEELDRSRVTSRREDMERQLSIIEMRARALAERHGRLAAGIALAAAAGFGLGLLIAGRRKQSTIRRMQNMVPNSVWDLPEELVGQLKKRAAKAL